jgi:peptide/nickel transport system substrate-binding protein
VSRRRFGAASLAVLLLALTVLSGASAGRHARAKPGGTLYVNLGTGEPGTLDPTLLTALSGVIVDRTMCERLYDSDSKGRVVPELAAALPMVSKDKLTYTIRLRKGIEFNDGTPFDAQAVATTIQRDKTLPGSIRASDFAPIASVTIAGPYELMFHLSTPFTPLAAGLASADGMIMSPAQLAKLGATFTTDPVCVGPFMFDHRVVGDNVTVVKSPYYYDKSAVHVDRIVFKFNPDSAAAAAALKAGDVQVAELSPTDLPGIEHDPRLKVLHQTQLGWFGVRFNIGNTTGHPPYSNLGTPFAKSSLLRQAFEEAINRKTLVKVVFGGNALADCTPISPASPWYDPRTRCTPYSPANARKLIAASGYTNPTVQLLTNNTTSLLDLAQFIQAEEAAVGINVVIDPTDLATQQSAASVGHFDVFLEGWSGNPDVDENIFQFLATSGSKNTGGYSNPRLDLILANSRKALTTTARKTLYRAALRIIAADRPIIYLYHSIRFAGVSKNVTGVELYPDVQLRVASAQFK